ncbi:MAG: MFS transporter, partial [Dehalococcoidia bacterium]
MNEQPPRSSGGKTTGPAAYRLPVTNRLLYASGSLGSQAVLQALLLWTVFLYSPTSGSDREMLLPIGLTGLLVFLSRAVDVISDPLVGYWSDRTSSRWGRRIPFILAGAPIMAVGFLLVWTPPEGLSTALTAAYLLGALSIFFIGHTLSGRPYDALLPELTPSSRERVNISAYRVSLGTLGAAAGLTISGLVIEQYGFILMGFIVGFIGMATRYTSVAGAWRWIQRDATPVRTGLRKGLALSLRNRPFRYYLASYLLLSMGLTMLVQLIPFHVEAILGEGERMVSLVTGAFLGTVLLGLPLVSKITAKAGKARVFRVGLLATALVLPCFFFAGFLGVLSPVAQVLIAAVLLGIAMSPCFVLPSVLMADVIDHDEDISGHRREAMYYGAEQSIQKIGIALSALIFTQVLAIFGHTAEDPMGLRLIGPLAAVLALVGFAVFAWG